MVATALQDLPDIVAELPQKRVSGRKMERLRQAIDDSRKRMQAFREHRDDIINQYLGNRYGNSPLDQDVPINMIEQAVNIYTTSLVPSKPRTLVEAKYTELRSQAWDFAQAINQKTKELDLKNILRLCVRDALISPFAVAKIHLDYTGDMVDTRLLDPSSLPGEVPVSDSTVSLVDLSDWVHDMLAPSLDAVTFCGHRRRVPRDELLQSDYLEGEAKARLQKETVTMTEEDGDQKPIAKSAGDGFDQEEFIEHVTLWEIWIPAEQVIVVYQEGVAGDSLKEIPWDGPKRGPYRFLCFNPVPNNTMPKPPASDWIAPHNIVNQLYRKMYDQARRQKTILAYVPGGEKDVKRIEDTPDGGSHRMDHPDAAKEVRWGGYDQPTLSFAMHLWQRFAMMAGNLEALGGLGASSETYGQDQLITAAANRRMAQMREQVMDFTREIVEALAWYEWTEPVRKRHFELSLDPSIGTKVPIIWDASTRRGQFLDYNFEICPYSMQEETPRSKLRSLIELFQIVMQSGPLLQQEGLVPNIEEFLRRAGEYLGVDRLQELITSSEQNPIEDAPRGKPPQLLGPQPQDAPATMRINRSIATPRGQDAALMQQLLAGRVQPAEAKRPFMPIG